MFLHARLTRSLGLMVLLLLSSLVRAQDQAPVIDSVLPIDQDMLEIRIHEHSVERFGPMPYVAKPGDVEVKWRNETWIKRDGRDFAALFQADPPLIFKSPTVNGPALDVEHVMQASNISIVGLSSSQTQAMQPVLVSRKSEPLEFVRVQLHEYDSSMEHHLYVKLPRSLQVGQRYRITITGHAPEMASFEYVHQPRKSVSPAVHATQVGFRANDPKSAFISIWLGDGGGYAYDIGRPFEVIDMQTDETCYKGKVTLSKAADDLTETNRKVNHNGTDVYRVRFDDFKREGRYRVYVQGVGCSLPFTIGPDVWDQPFVTVARGLYHQRSGIELGPPYTDYKRPRPHHPADGFKIIQSDVMYLDPRTKNTQFSRFKDLVKYATNKTTDQAWGGYMDAGDWDRRIEHLRMSQLIFELLQAYPQYMNQVKLNIPESANKLPDLLDEALFNLDCYRRMQREDGGVPGGMESEEHPIYGQTSWQDTLRLYQFAPGPYATYGYAACAMHAASVLKQHDPKLAKVYEDSGLKAMQWAEAQLQTGKFDKLGHLLSDARNLAALMCYIHTGQSHWHELFKQTSVFQTKQYRLSSWQKFDQADAAYHYQTLPADKTDPTIREHAAYAMQKEADRLMQAGQNTAFDWTGDPSAGVGWGRLSVPQSTTLIRAYRLTGKKSYYDATVASTMIGTGANPSNISYTTGVGSEYVKVVLHVDSLRREIAPPLGLTVMGPMEQRLLTKYWAMKFVKPHVYPAWQNWPTTDAFWRVPIMARTREYTIHGTLAPNIYVWGCLAATGR